MMKNLNPREETPAVDRQHPNNQQITTTGRLLQRTSCLEEIVVVCWKYFNTTMTSDWQIQCIN